MDSEKKYWNNFYNTNKKINLKCSDFCIFVMNYFNDNKNIINVLDCGCGNGRDSYMLNNKYNVDAVDTSGFIPTSKDNLNFSCDDFVNIDKSKYNLIYSRFTFHSITNDQHKQFIDTIKPNTYLAIEARSIKGEKYDVYYGKTHYRNYIDIDYIKKLLETNNFEILVLEEGINMAKYKNENPVCIRVLCKKY